MLTGLIFPLLLLLAPSPAQSEPPTVCIIGSGIAGSSAAHFLRLYSKSNNSPRISKIRMFERNGVVGGRMATVSIGGNTFEAGASILHPKNYHALNFTKLLNLTIKEPSSSSDSFAIWDGHRIIFKTLKSDSNSPFVQRIVSSTNSILMFVRYGLSLFRMSNFVEVTVDRFLNYYTSVDSRPVFETVEGMLEWAASRDDAGTQLCLRDDADGRQTADAADAPLSPVSPHI
ncbi:hypothetical protein RJ640_008199 [Escallonia rubra]|uniref:Prenylcysteine lyase domain-containing protein n=1 Tax=Escallonia rubra TaxID=112253 RepID=A0AA88QXI6_9ASTE|nr:hypothetical protein RJ640_008199 [Escallonia rubra]